VNVYHSLAGDVSMFPPILVTSDLEHFSIVQLNATVNTTFDPSPPQIMIAFGDSGFLVSDVAVMSHNIAR
jgi:hypothetical protein